MPLLNGTNSMAYSGTVSTLIDSNHEAYKAQEILIEKPINPQSEQPSTSDKIGRQDPERGLAEVVCLGSETPQLAEVSTEPSGLDLETKESRE